MSSRVTVFGATGNIGRLVVERLLREGYDVTAYVRNPAKLTLADPRLSVVTGQLSDAAGIQAAIAGTDAVISTLGPSLRRGATGTPVTDGTRHIVAAMGSARVHRYLGLATPSVADPRDQPTVTSRVLPTLAKVLFPNALAELIGMTSVVTESDLDWTVARITRPTDATAKGTIRAGFLGRDRVGLSMTRADIAGFLIDQLTSDTYLRALPAISN